MEFIEQNGRRYARFERLGALPGLVHAFSTRPLDVSPREDPQRPVRTERRADMVRDWGLDADKLHHCVQIHDTRIAFMDTPPTTARALRGTDGIVANVPHVPLMTFSADCPLVLAYDPRQRVVGMVHASWRCTVARIASSLIETMTKRYGCRLADLHAGIGPSAGPEQYEVQDDLYEAAVDLPERERLFPRRDGRMCFDLWEANRQLLLAAGVPEEQIEVAGICTMTRTDLFFSFRREGPGCGHFGLMAGLR